MTPGMDGWAVLTTLKADAVTTDIPLVMLTYVAAINAKEPLPELPESLAAGRRTLASRVTWPALGQNAGRSPLFPLPNLSSRLRPLHHIATKAVKGSERVVETVNSPSDQG
jgi:hypothetical protein